MTENVSAPAPVKKPVKIKFEEAPVRIKIAAPGYIYKKNEVWEYREVKGYVTDLGLAITPTTMFTSRSDMWTITHIPSGAAFEGSMGVFLKLQTAEKAVALLADFADWNKPFEEVHAEVYSRPNGREDYRALCRVIQELE